MSSILNTFDEIELRDLLLRAKNITFFGEPITGLDRETLIVALVLLADDLQAEKAFQKTTQKLQGAINIARANL